jgi:hypothetical protein
VKWIEEVRNSLDEPITGREARWLRIAGYVLVAPFLAVLALGCAVMVLGTVFGIVVCVLLAVQHGLWWIPASVLAGLMILSWVTSRLEGW